jgi:hypothetical protein
MESKPGDPGCFPPVLSLCGPDDSAVVCACVFHLTASLKSHMGLGQARLILGPYDVRTKTNAGSTRSDLLRAGRSSHEEVVPLRPQCTELLL